jgi:GTP-binding protein
VKPDRLARKLTEVRAVMGRHAAAFPEVTVTSARTGLGIEELRASLATLAA